MLGVMRCRKQSRCDVVRMMRRLNWSSPFLCGMCFWRFNFLPTSLFPFVLLFLDWSVSFAAGHLPLLVTPSCLPEPDYSLSFLSLLPCIASLLDRSYSCDLDPTFSSSTLPLQLLWISSVCLLPDLVTFFHEAFSRGQLRILWPWVPIFVASFLGFWFL